MRIPSRLSFWLHATSPAALRARKSSSIASFLRSLILNLRCLAQLGAELYAEIGVESLFRQGAAGRDRGQYSGPPPENSGQTRQPRSASISTTRNRSPSHRLLIRGSCRGSGSSRRAARFCSDEAAALGASRSSSLNGADRAMLLASTISPSASQFFRNVAAVRRHLRFTPFTQCFTQLLERTVVTHSVQRLCFFAVNDR